MADKAILQRPTGVCQEPVKYPAEALLDQQYRENLGEDATKYLNYIINSSDRMKTLVSDLLDYSRLGRKKELKKIDCNVLLEEVLADLYNSVKETQAVITADRLPIITGYVTELALLFQNLVSNAIKFRKKDTLPQIHIAAHKEGEYWQFSFRDNGIGIEEKYQERIFIIFQRLHNRTEYKGSGIGLAHCRKIVELHGGKIWFESKGGGGKYFLFYASRSFVIYWRVIRGELWVNSLRTSGNYHGPS